MDGWIDERGDGEKKILEKSCLKEDGRFRVVDERERKEKRRERFLHGGVRLRKCVEQAVEWEDVQQTGTVCEGKKRG